MFLFIIFDKLATLLDNAQIRKKNDIKYDCEFMIILIIIF